MHNIMDKTPEEGYERITFDFNKNHPAIIDPTKYGRYMYLSELLELRDMIDSVILSYKKDKISDDCLKELSKYKVNEAMWKEYTSHRVRNKTPNGFLYLFVDRENNKLKIGRSTNPKRRLKQLEYEFSVVLESLFEIEDMAYDEEYALWLFREYNLHGEWFSYQKEIIHYFEQSKYAKDFEIEYNEYLEYLENEQ